MTVTPLGNDEGLFTLDVYLNGRRQEALVPPGKRLSEVLRDDFGLTGVKVGCNAGDCGSCTILIDGDQVCACLVSAAQANDRMLVTVEGMASNGFLSRVQEALYRHGAAQCGICTPGVLAAATHLLGRKQNPTKEEVLDAMGGVLCRCTGYQKIVDALLDSTNSGILEDPEVNVAVGAPIGRLDGVDKLEGKAIFGADGIPEGSLWLRVVRSPHPRASFTLGDLKPLYAKHKGLVRILTSHDIPGRNGFGIYPDIKDQPVFAKNEVRYRGEAILALVGDRLTVEKVRDDDLPIHYKLGNPIVGIEAARSANASLVHASKPGNLLIDGGVRKGRATEVLSECMYVAEGEWSTGFVEHAYIEPEAGYARRVGERIEIHVSTQTPYMDLDEVSGILGIAEEKVRIIPTWCGGGFGGKLDQSVQPMIAVAAWLLDKPVACVYTRPESMAASTKRHPSKIKGSMGCDKNGRLMALHLTADFDTGAYASWGPTVAGRVPVHATGPYLVPNVCSRGRAYFTNSPPAGAFRGFGVPQAAIVHEGLMDDLAESCGMDPLDFRIMNALKEGEETATGQILKHSVGILECLESLRSHWTKARSTIEKYNGGSRVVKRGAGIGCMWYGCGNTGMSNPSTMRIGLKPNGRITLYNGAVDIGQGSFTVMAQIAADALGVPLAKIDQVLWDTSLTPDSGKTSASRQTYVSGRATELAARRLRLMILREANLGEKADISLEDGFVRVKEENLSRNINLSERQTDINGDVFSEEQTFDPPATPLDSNGQGEPYGTYAFAAQMAVVEVDIELGTTKVLNIVAAHDVGRAINPALVEGQIHGGIAQGLGLALMEEYLPGVTENLHDYLIPTFGDMPEIKVILIEKSEPTGPFGAKGIGEPALIPTAPAILGAIRSATGVKVKRIPATPARLRELM